MSNTKITTTTTTSTLSTTIQNQLNQLTTKSSKIRFLSTQNYTRYQISKILNIRYQHVRNVLITPVKTPK